MLFIDSRESLLVQVQIESVLPPDKTRTIKLDCADFLLLDQCSPAHTMGIERKTVSDLLGSLGSGRLSSQLDRMTDLYTYPVLLVEGAMPMSKPGTKIVGRKGGGPSITAGGFVVQRSRETGWRHGAVQMALLGAQWTYGIDLLWTAGLQETADVLRVLYARSLRGCLEDTRRRGKVEALA